MRRTSFTKFLTVPSAAAFVESPVARLRKLLLISSGLLMAGTVSVMIFFEHGEETAQWILFVLCGLGLVGVGAALLWPQRAVLLGLRASTSVVVIGSVFVAYERITDNLDLRLVAPAVLTVAAVLAVVATYRHPAIANASQADARAMDDYEAAMQSGDGVLKALVSINPKTQTGLEIGPLARPLVRKPNPIFYLDRLPTDELRAYFAAQGLDPSTIVEVDFVCDEQPVSESVEGRHFDYVLASHIVEHVPDLVGWLQDIGLILRPQGVLSLIVPDGRYTFDILRRETTISQVLKAQGSKQPTPDQLYDHHAHYVEVDAAAIWTHGRPPDLKPANSKAQARSLARSTGYQDAHCWVFTPDSFVSIITGLSSLGLIAYDVRHVFPTLPGTNEFFVTITART